MKGRVMQLLNSLLGWIRSFIGRHLLTLLAIGFAVYALWAVPQIANLWMQVPPIFGGWLLSVLYIIFVAYLALFYGLSLQINQGWRSIEELQKIQDTHSPGSTEVSAKKWTVAWLWRWMHLPPQVASSWLNRPVFGHRAKVRVLNSRKRWKILVLGVMCVTVCLIIFVWGATKIGSRWYTLAGAYCQFAGFWFLVLGAWFIFVFGFAKNDDQHAALLILSRVGRLLAWVLATSLFGEALWLLSCGEAHYC